MDNHLCINSLTTVSRTVRLKPGLFQEHEPRKALQLKPELFQYHDPQKARVVQLKSEIGTTFFKNSILF